MNIQDIENRHAKATAGPWIGKHGTTVEDERGHYIASCPRGWRGLPMDAFANSDFIAHSWQDIRALLDALAEAQGRIGELERESQMAEWDRLAALRGEN
jgi:hypothetical protein